MRKYVQRNMVWLRSDPISVVLWPVIMIGALTIGGLLFERSFLSHWYYTSYSLAVAACANRVCLRSGIICAGLGAISHATFFAASSWYSLPQLAAYASLFLLCFVVGRRARLVSLEDVDNLPDQLPFVSTDGDNAHKFWAAEDEGDWVRNCARGKHYGNLWKELAVRGRAPPITWILHDMITAQQWTGVEAGFIRAVTVNRRLTSADDDPNNPQPRIPVIEQHG